MDGVDHDGPFEVAELRRDLARVQHVDGVTRLEHKAWLLIQKVDVVDGIHVRGGFAFLPCRHFPKPEHRPGFDARDIESQLVLAYVVGHGAPREIGTGHVIEARWVLDWGDVGQVSFSLKGTWAYYLRWRNVGPMSESS